MAARRSTSPRSCRQPWRSPASGRLSARVRMTYARLKPSRSVRAWPKPSRSRRHRSFARRRCRSSLATMERDGFRACEAISVVSAFRRTLSGPAEAGHYPRLDFFTRSLAERCSAKPAAERMLSPNWRRLTRRLLIDRLDGCEGVGLGGGLVRSIPLDPREAEREPAGIVRARLDVVERDLGDDLGTDVDGVIVAADLELEKRLRLPREHLVGQPLERLAEHDKAAPLAVPRAEMQVAECA